MDMSARYTEMQTKGMANLVSGDVTSFSGADDSLKRRLIFASCWPVPKVVADLFDDLLCVEETDFNFIFAGADYPLHATLKQAKVPDNVVWPDEFDTHLLQACSQVEFDTLILDGANLILAASNVPDELVALRAELDQELVKYGFEPLPLPILHITLVRMTQVPESGSGKQKAFASYQEVMLPWCDKLAEKPVVLDLSANVRMTSTYDLLTAPFRTD